MITLYGFGRIFRGVVGETKELRIEWALQEMNLPYRVYGLDHTAGEHEGPAYTEINEFRLVPAIDDDGFRLSESGAILLYLAEKYGQLLPKDFQGRMQVTKWCFAALNTLERPMIELHLIEKFGMHPEMRDEMTIEAKRWLSVLDRHLASSTWVTGEDFTVADILTACVLREIRHGDLMSGFANVKAFYERARSRPAWQRALKSYADRLEVTVDEIS